MSPVNEGVFVGIEDAKEINPRKLVARVRLFLSKPARMRYVALANRVRRVVRSMPVPLRLPFGAWWLAENSALDRSLIYEGFETAETAFVGRFLRPGMTVLDVGAHHGLYTLLASKRAGRDGRVIAFEPSWRERRRLARHLRINRCGNVEVHSCALGDRAARRICIWWKASMTGATVCERRMSRRGRRKFGWRCGGWTMCSKA